MNDATFSSTGQPQFPGGFDRFANAPVLPFGLGHEWMVRARAVWRSNFGFLLLATLLVLGARWQLDFMEGAVIIFLSYLSDGILFTWVFLGLQRQPGEPGQLGLLVGWRALLAGWRALKGRWKAVLLSSLWGLPAAGASYALFAFGPQLIEALVLAIGINLVGIATLLALVLTAAFITFLLCMLPVLAGVHAARDEHAGFRVGGLWAYRGIRSGWRPLLVVFMVFICACAVAATVLTWTIGHLPVEWLANDSGWTQGLGYWYPWPGLLVAMNFFLALLQPMVGDLLQAADTDLSDEITSAQHKEREGQQFVRIVLRRVAFAVRTAAAFCVLFGLLYSTVLGEMQQLVDWLGAAVTLYVAGGAVYRWSERWKPANAVPVAEAVPVSATTLEASEPAAAEPSVAAPSISQVTEAADPMGRRILTGIFYVLALLLMLTGALTTLQGLSAFGDRTIAAFGGAGILMGLGTIALGLLLLWVGRRISGYSGS